MEPFAGCQGQPEHVAVGERELHHIGLLAQRPQLVLLTFVHREHQKFDHQHDIPLPRHQVEPVHHHQRGAAHAGLYLAVSFSQRYRHTVAGLPVQAQEGDRSRKVVRENKVVVYRPSAELPYSETGRVLQEKSRERLA